MLRWTKSSPGSRPTISFAGTRLSAHPIHRYFGFCCRGSRAKKSGSLRRIRSDHARLLSNKGLSGCIEDMWTPSLDHFAGTNEQRLRERQPERLGGLEAEHELA